MYAIEMWNLICVTGSLSRESSYLPLKNEAHKVRNAKPLAAMEGRKGRWTLDLEGFSSDSSDLTHARPRQFHLALFISHFTVQPTCSSDVLVCQCAALADLDMKTCRIILQAKPRP